MSLTLSPICHGKIRTCRYEKTYCFFVRIFIVQNEFLFGNKLNAIQTSSQVT